MILELPSDHSVLESSEFKSRGFKKGGRVALVRYHSLPQCIYICRLNYNRYCKDFLGSLKEYVAIDWNTTTYAVPDTIPTRIAAAVLSQGLTALTQLTESYNVQKGDIVLVHTVAGGVGLLLAQMAKARGATVIGTTSTPEKAVMAKAHGADHVLLYKKENTVKRVLELTDGKGANVIYDGVGKATYVFVSTLRYRSYVLQVR